MRQNGEMTDEKRLALLNEYLSSGKSKWRFQKEKGLSHSSISNWLRIFAVENKPVEEFFPKLLRRSGGYATKGWHSTKSCRKQKKIWRFQILFLNLHQNKINETTMKRKIYV